jgi:hypothetical protein
VSGPQPKTNHETVGTSTPASCALPWGLPIRFAVYTRLVNRTTELRDTLQNLKGFDDWLRRLGVPLRQAGRAHHAICVLEKAQRVFEACRVI